MESERKGSRGDEERYDLEILLRRPSLRANIPRRISQVCREAIPTEETTCGVGCLQGQWLQSFANRTSFVFIYGVLGSFYGSYHAYFYGAVSSLEKRFKISSQSVGMIASLGDLTMAITCFVLSFCVPKTQRPGLIGLGILLIIASTIIFVLPHFLTQPKNMGISTRDYSSYLKNDSDFTQCQNQSCSGIPGEENGHVLLFLSQTLRGIGGGLYFTAGKSYKDENIEKHPTLALLSLLTVLTILGPAFGYWLSSIFLKIFEYPNLMPHITEEQPQWLGAWWLVLPYSNGHCLSQLPILTMHSINISRCCLLFLIFRCLLRLVTLFPSSTLHLSHPHYLLFVFFVTLYCLSIFIKTGGLVIGFMLIIPGFLIILFPKELPKAAIKRIHTQLKSAAEESDGKKALKNLFFNPAFNSTHFAAIFNIMGFMAYFIYLPKYVETQYRISASNSNLIAGSVTLISSAAGIVTANSVITRYHPSARVLASWTIIVGILSMGGCLSYIYLGCQAIDDEAIAIVNQNSNATFKCENTPFFPVCDEYSQSFTSPCHAGCGNILYINYLQGYEICNHTHQSSQPRKVFTGFCFSDCHSKFLKFIIVTCSITFLYATGRTSNYWFKMNYKNQGELLALSSGMSFLGLLVTIPAPIIFGFLLDESCIFWDGKNNRGGNCWLYDNKKLRLTMNLTAVGYAVFGIIYDLWIWYSVKNLELFEDDDYDFDESDEK